LTLSDLAKMPSNTKRELYATLMLPSLQVHRHIKVTPVVTYGLALPGGPLIQILKQIADVKSGHRPMVETSWTTTQLLVTADEHRLSDRPQTVLESCRRSWASRVVASGLHCLCATMTMMTAARGTGALKSQDWTVTEWISPR